MNIKYIYNPTLKVNTVDIPSFDAYMLYDNKDNWILTYPTSKFIDLYYKIRAIHPLKWEDNPKFWDTLKGFDAFNHALSAFTQEV